MATTPITALTVVPRAADEPALFTTTCTVAAELTAPAVAVTTLYSIEDLLASLVDTLDIVPAEQEQELLADIIGAMDVAIDKRDATGRFLAHLEGQVQLAKSEIDRLTARKRTYERVIESVENYVLGVIVKLGRDSKKKWRKLEGRLFTFKARNCPASADITDEAAVPLEYRTATIKLPAKLWEELLDAVDVELGGRVLDSMRRTDEVPKTAVLEALKAGTAVAGARLVDDKVNLVRE